MTSVQMSRGLSTVLPTNCNKPNFKCVGLFHLAMFHMCMIYLFSCFFWDVKKEQILTFDQPQQTEQTLAFNVCLSDELKHQWLPINWFDCLSADRFPKKKKRFNLYFYSVSGKWSTPSVPGRSSTIGLLFSLTLEQHNKKSRPKGRESTNY